MKPFPPPLPATPLTPLTPALRHGRRGRAGDRGAVLVEFGLIVPLLVFMLLGIVEFGYQMNNYQALRSGVREAARRGTVVNFGPSAACALDPAAGTASVNVQRLMCLTEQQVGLGGGTRTRVLIAPSDLTDTSAPWAAGNSLVVCAEAPLNSITGLFQPLLSGKSIKTKVTARIEQPTGGSETAGSEPSPGGWAWCTPAGSAP